VRPDGRLLLVDRTAAMVEVRDPDSGAVLDRWPVIGIPARIAADTSADNPGGAFVLTREGWVWRLEAGGAVRAWWSAARDATGGAVAPTDLAVAPDGRVVVLDGANDRALVYAPNPGAPPPLAPTGEGCTFLRDKRAAPPRITIGDTVGVTLTVTGQCLGQGQGADIVLVVDRSGSMEGQKLAAAKAAVAAFAGDLDFAQSRAGMVIFNLEAELRVPLSADPGAVLAGLSSFDAGGGTDIGKAVDVAADELRANGRPGVEPIIVLMTDGRPDNAEIDADDAALRARSAGIRLFTIGFGPDTDAGLMRRMASSADDYFFAPTEAELAGIYLEIARRISGSVILETATITDVVPANMDFVVGSAQPLATWDAPSRTITWRISEARAGLTLSYRLRPTQTGTHPTNVEARMRYRDGLQSPGELVFPIPRVTVLGPPRPIYLPMAVRNYCPPKARPADVALVIDTSSSMTGAKLAAAKAAATSFVNLLALPFDRATVVGFNRDARLAALLTGDRSTLRAAIDGLSITPGTVIDGGLRTATAELFGRRRRAEALPVIVLLTDGRNNAGPAPVLGAAAAARAAGARIYTIALGADADPELMRQVAGNAARAFVAPGPSDLERIYGDIAALIPCD
jgi:Mg-chelatase subunit ChlD